MGYFSFVPRWFSAKAAQGKAKGEANAALAKSKTMDATESARVNIEATGENVANKANNSAAATEHATEATAHHTADTTTSATNAPVEKVKGHRPKASKHESVEKFKHAFHINKDKHDKNAPVPTEV